MDINKILQYEDASQKDKIKDKITSEKKMRQSVLAIAKAQGEYQYKEAINIFDRYDKALKNCTNEGERRHISIMGIAELHRLLNCRGALVVNGLEILPAKEVDDGQTIIT